MTQHDTTRSSVGNSNVWVMLPVTLALLLTRRPLYYSTLRYSIPSGALYIFLFYLFLTLNISRRTRIFFFFNKQSQLQVLILTAEIYRQLVFDCVLVSSSSQLSSGARTTPGKVPRRYQKHSLKCPPV